MDIHEHIRLELRRLRRTAGLTEAKLARRMHLHKTTVYRVEDVSDRPDYEPTLATIARWLDATSQETLTAFFCRVEFSGTNDLKKFTKLRMLVHKCEAEIEILFEEAQELHLPQDEKRFGAALKRALRRLDWRRTHKDIAPPSMDRRHAG